MIIWWELYKKILERWIIEDIEMEKNSKKLRLMYKESLNSGISNLKFSY